MALTLAAFGTSCGLSGSDESVTVQGGVSAQDEAAGQLVSAGRAPDSERHATGNDGDPMRWLSRLSRESSGDAGRHPGGDGRPGHGATTTEAPGTTTSAMGSGAAVKPLTPSGPSITTQQTTTTERRATSTASTTASSGGGSGRFETLPPGASLPTGAECAARVRSEPEVRAGNTGYNSTRGTRPNGRYPRVDGNFDGTTDEILQWAACKWGIDEDWVRAQVAKESWWDMKTAGDRNSDQDACHPDLRTATGSCPESVGLMQVRYLYHLEAFDDSNAIRSSAYNVDYAYAVWRSCYDGELTWLNDVERGGTYRAGDLEGCLGVWFTGRWLVPSAYPYIEAVRDLKNSRVWESSDFLNVG